MKKMYINLFLVSLLLLSSSTIVYAANELRFEADLSGAQEVTSPAGGVVTDTTGAITVEFDKALTKVQFHIAVRNGTGIT